MIQSGPSARPFFVTMGIWLILAIVLGARDRLVAMPPPMPQVMIAALALTLILSGVLNPRFREWLANVNLRGFVAFHLTRLVGIAFLVMYARGELNGEFAITAGWGDIIAATGALVLVLVANDPLRYPRALFLWNMFGMLDILLVVITATRIALASPAEMLPILRFPMSLVPTFVVPIVIASHVLIFWRLRRANIVRSAA